MLDEQAIRIDNQQPGYYENKGRALMKQGRKQEAKQAFAIARRLRNH